MASSSERRISWAELGSVADAAQPSVFSASAMTSDAPSERARASARRANLIASSFSLRVILMAASVAYALASSRVSPSGSSLLAADTARRTAISTADSLRADQKAASKKVGAASADERPALLQRAKELAEQVKAAETQQADAEARFAAAHMAISNVIIDGVPAGGEDDFSRPRRRR